MPAWAVPAAIIGSAVIGAVSQSANSGKSGGQPMYTSAYMPEKVRSKFEGSMAGMPASTNVRFGGQVYPTTYGPLRRTAEMMYKPSGVIPNEYSPNAFTGAMTAAAPYMWQWAMQPNKDQPGQPATAPAVVSGWNPYDMSTYGTTGGYPYYRV